MQVPEMISNNLSLKALNKSFELILDILPYF